MGRDVSRNLPKCVVVVDLDFLTGWLVLGCFQNILASSLSPGLAWLSLNNHYYGPAPGVFWSDRVVNPSLDLVRAITSGSNYINHLTHFSDLSLDSHQIAGQTASSQSVGDANSSGNLF